MTNICIFEGCTRVRKFKNGYCRMHYARWKRKGSATEIIYPTSCQNCGAGGLIKKGFCDKCYRRMLHHGHLHTLIADDGQGNINRDGYKVHVRNGQRVLEHREVMQAPSGTIVHHKDGNRLNNDPDNLEIMTRGKHTALHNRLRGGMAR